MFAIRENHVFAFARNIKVILNVITLEIIVQIAPFYLPSRFVHRYFPSPIPLIQKYPLTSEGINIPISKAGAYIIKLNLPRMPAVHRTLIVK